MFWTMWQAVRACGTAARVRRRAELREAPRPAADSVLAQAVAHKADGQGIAGGLVNEQEVAHRAACGVVLHGQFGLGLDGQVGDIVHGHGLGVFYVGHAIEIQGASNRGDAGFDQGGTIAQFEHLAGLEILFGQADHRGVEFPGGLGTLGAGEEITAGEIDVIGKQQRHRIAGGGRGGRAIGGIDLGNGAGAALGQVHRIAHGDGPSLHAAGVAAVIGGVLPDDVLDGKNESPAHRRGQWRRG